MQIHSQQFHAVLFYGEPILKLELLIDYELHYIKHTYHKCVYENYMM